jgi:hypothetical protein
MQSRVTSLVCGGWPDKDVGQAARGSYYQRDKHGCRLVRKRRALNRACVADGGRWQDQGENAAANVADDEQSAVCSVNGGVHEIRATYPRGPFPAHVIGCVHPFSRAPEHPAQRCVTPRDDGRQPRPGATRAPTKLSEGRPCSGLVPCSAQKSSERSSSWSGALPEVRPGLTVLRHAPRLPTSRIRFISHAACASLLLIDKLVLGYAKGGVIHKHRHRRGRWLRILAYARLQGLLVSKS